MSDPSDTKGPPCGCGPDGIPASERIAAQHSHLREMVGQIQGTIRDRPDRRDVVVHEISALLKELEVHFRTEEEEGFFDQIDACAPQLTSETARLKGEHQTLLTQMRSLTALAETCEGSDPWWERLNTDFHEFSTNIMRHESAENQLLQRAFNEDIGSHD